jgi:hypothetical protein
VLTMKISRPCFTPTFPSDYHAEVQVMIQLCLLTLMCQMH